MYISKEGFAIEKGTCAIDYGPQFFPLDHANC